MLVAQIQIESCQNLKMMLILSIILPAYYIKIGFPSASGMHVYLVHLFFLSWTNPFIVTNTDKILFTIYFWVEYHSWMLIGSGILFHIYVPREGVILQSTDPENMFCGHIQKR